MEFNITNFVLFFQFFIIFYHHVPKKNHLMNVYKDNSQNKIDNLTHFIHKFAGVWQIQYLSGFKFFRRKNFPRRLDGYQAENERKYCICQILYEQYGLKSKSC